MISRCGWSVRNVFAKVSPQGRTARMMLTNMYEVFVWSSSGEATVLTHKDLGAALAIGVLLPHAVDLPQVGLQGAALGEGFLTELTPIGPNALQQGTQDSHQTGVLKWTSAIAYLHKEETHAIVLGGTLVRFNAREMEGNWGQSIGLQNDKKQV